MLPNLDVQVDTLQGNRNEPLGAAHRLVLLWSPFLALAEAAGQAWFSPVVTVPTRSAKRAKLKEKESCQYINFGIK